MASSATHPVDNSPDQGSEVVPKVSYQSFANALTACATSGVDSAARSSCGGSVTAWEQASNAADPCATFLKLAAMILQSAPCLSMNLASDLIVATVSMSRLSMRLKYGAM